MSAANLWIGSIATALAAIGLAFAVYFTLRRLMASRIGDDTESLAGSIITRIGILHALILALMFGQEMENYLSVTKQVTAEAGAVADVYYGLKRYDEYRQGTTAETVFVTAEYVKAVLEDEWPMLAQGQLHPKAWEKYVWIDRALLYLDPVNRYQTDLRTELLSDWDAVSELRRAREAAAERRIPDIFWILAVLGFVAVVMPYYVYTPSRANLALLGLFAAFNGMVFYLIIGLGNPFGGVAPIKPVALEQLYAEEMAGIAGGQASGE